jgi:hypothetical protein
MERRDPEVPERARRRTFTAKYKLEILAAYGAAPDGQKGALLRREGPYTSHIVQWLRARDTGALAAQAEQIARLEQEKRQLDGAGRGCAGKTAHALGHVRRERGYQGASWAAARGGPLMAGYWRRTPVRFPPTVWRGLKLRALDYDTSAVALVRQALTDALEGDTAALAALSHQYRDIPGQLVTLDLPIRLHRRLRLEVIAHRSTAMAVVLAATSASWPELMPPAGLAPAVFNAKRQPTQGD